MLSKKSAQICGRKSQLQVLKAKQTLFILKYPEPQVQKMWIIYWAKSLLTCLVLYVHKDQIGHSQRWAVSVDGPLV